MPYSGISDPTLPARIKKMPAVKQRAFVGAFNSAIKDDPKDEGKAFAIANAAANRAGEKAMPENITAVGEKHDHGMDQSSGGPIPVVVVDEYERIEPWGGATSFVEFDRVNEEGRRTGALEYTFFQFNDLLQNILRSDALTVGQKVDRVRGLVEELGPRLDAVTRDPTIAYKADGDLPVTDDPGTFQMFKDANGDWRWVAIHTNRYEDNTGEIFAEEGHKAFVDWVEESGQYPPLRFWHLPVDLGPSDFLDYTDEGFMVSSGTFHEGMKSAAEALSKMKGMGCSHGFLYNAADLVGGVYRRYKSFEVSVLPVDKAANRLTQFIAGKDIPMISTEKRDLAVKIFGESGVKAIDEAIGDLDATARSTGLRYKDLAAFGLGGGKEGTVPDETNTTATATAVAEPATPAVPAATTEAAQVTEGEAAPAEAPATAPAADSEGAAEAAATEGEAATTEGGDGSEPAEPDGTPSASTVTPSGPADVEAAKALEPLMTAFKGMLDTALQPLQQQVAAQAQEIAALKQDDDTKIAAAISPRVGPSYVDAAASRAAGSEVPAGEVPASVAQGVKQAEEGAKALADGGEMLHGIEAYLAQARVMATRGLAGDVE